MFSAIASTQTATEPRGPPIATVAAPGAIPASGKSLRLPGYWGRWMPSAGPEPGPDIAGSEQPVRPEWNWEGEYYCSDVAIGTRDLGHDCQVVTVSENRIAYTQKKGSGQTPTFELE